MQPLQVSLDQFRGRVGVKLTARQDRDGAKTALLRLVDRAPSAGPRLRADPAVSEAMTRWAAINTMTRRLARGGPAARQQHRTFAPAE